MLTKANVSNKQETINTPSRTADDSPHETIIEESSAPKGVNNEEIARQEGRKNCKDKKRKLNEDKGVVDALNRLRSTLEKQVGVNQASLNMKEQAMKKEMELKEKVMRREIELKEAAQKQRKEDHAIKMKEQRKQQIMNQDLCVLSPSLRASYEAMQAKILKDWENEILH
ncbi:K+ efflux antiporter 1 [Striga asiatica]|uniref:K+ efflux antiporter 1 n=1 Tax=Striga asiatica TaxID=4170 RepID=A0A5A7PL22_STRAF|nr:K+ efflux antiporter 1 [Striga asiatica]